MSTRDGAHLHAVSVLECPPLHTVRSQEGSAGTDERGRRKAADVAEHVGKRAGVLARELVRKLHRLRTRRATLSTRRGCSPDCSHRVLTEGRRETSRARSHELVRTRRPARCGGYSEYSLYAVRPTRPTCLDGMRTGPRLQRNNARLQRNNAHLQRNNAHLQRNNSRLQRNNAHLQRNNAH